GSEYARSKIEAEQAVRSQSKMKTTIVRPTLIYDSQGGQEFMMFFDSLLKYPVVPFVGSGKVKKRPVYSEDIVTGLLAIVGNERSYGKSYDFSGGEEISMRHLAHLLLEIVGRKKIIIPVPIFICKILALLMEKSMSHPPLTRYGISRIVHETAFDHSSAKEDLGYNPIRVSEGLKLCNFSDRI
ncbi:MAG: sugar nucleotide-binding protein, partial [Bacteroidetes bacterium]|nr:sugar nucleotide-binding protein [Bacteroidota bacterium]